MTPHELATHLVVLRVLADRIKRSRGAMDDEAKGTLRIKDRLTAELPDGTEVGSVTLNKGRTTAEVADEQTFTNWVAENHPSEIVMAVRDSFRKIVLTDVQKHGGIVDRASGELVNVPGVSRKTGDPYPSVRPNDEAAAAIAAAWRDGTLELGSVLREIEAGHE